MNKQEEEESSIQKDNHRQGQVSARSHIKFSRVVLGLMHVSCNIYHYKRKELNLQWI